MANKIIDILLRFKSQTKGAKDATGAVKGNRRSVVALTAAYKALRGVTRGVFRGIASGARTARRVMLGVTAAAAGSIREFYVWNKEAAKAWTMMGGGVKAFYKLRKEVSALSGELGVAKSELGKGWYQALSAGVNESDIVGFLGTAAKVAVADGSSIETAIDGVTTVLNAFKIEASKSNKVADLMFRTVRYGKTSFSDLASYISQAAPTASALGVGIDQVLAAVASLTKQGVPTSTAMLQIRNAMLGLNRELGDGWAKTHTLQGALETVAKRGGYSASALTKAFGRQNVSGVLALVGTNARNAAKDLATMRGEGGGLDEAFNKVNSETGHWRRALESARALISDIGEALDTALRPAINWITKKLQDIRKSTNFGDLIKSIGDKVRNAVAAAIAGVNTVIDVISKSTVGGLIAGSVAALIDLAISLLAAGIRSLTTVVVALAKVAAAALAKEFMKMDLPFRNEEKAARKAASKKIGSLTADQRKELGVPDELFDNRDRMQSPEQAKAFAAKQQAFIDALTLDQAASIATANSDANIDNALSEAGKSFSATRTRLTGDTSRIISDLSRRTGQDISGTYAGHRTAAEERLSRIQQSMYADPEPEAPPAAPPRVLSNAERYAQFQEEQRRQKLLATARRPGTFGNATPGDFDAAIGAQKELYDMRHGQGSADAAIKATEKLLEETDSSWGAMKTVLDAVAAAMRKQSADIATVKEKINNLPGGR